MLTDDDIKKMLNGIINNNEEWEVCVPAEIALDDLLNNDGTEHIIVDQEYEWHPYKLGDEIHKDWEYRKVEKYIVFYNMNCKLEIDRKSKHSKMKLFEFEGSKEECEEWIEEHRKKSWFEELNSKISPNAKNLDFKVKETATKVCKKILIEFQDNKAISTNNVLVLEKIIKDLGIEL